ncbi:hypothetical protein DERP_000524 [Dermatophagoides pteronyssinus]|uniref:Uncharacterized protein n=1 Tax=Dermatophagoides pteronyssinus TaxID=6956 RepID=A0ABQ8J0H0_DERPT|nr:hypothetical protein DERP_000524 [Dermatophagoides pteronyssinus]
MKFLTEINFLFKYNILIMSANHSETIINNYNNEMATSTIPTTNTIITTMNDNNNDYNSNFEILFMLQVKYRIIFE